MAQPALRLDPPNRALGASFGAYFRLTKPRVIELLLVTAVPPMFLAEGGFPPLYLVLAVVAGGAMAAGGANTINCWIERDRDQLMRRTHGRPLPSGEIDPGACARVRHRAQRARVRAARDRGEPAVGGAHAVGDAVLRVRVHDLAEAAHGPEHRDRRRGRRGAGARRLGRGPRRPRAPRVDPLRRRVLLDARALLGARDEVPRRLRRGRDPDASRDARRRRSRPGRSRRTR